MHMELRRGSRYPIMFGDSGTRDAWLAECEKQRTTQTCRYTVSPCCALELPDGRRLKGGERVRPQDLYTGPNGKNTHAVLRDLVFKYEVLENDRIEEDGPPPDPRFA